MIDQEVKTVKKGKSKKLLKTAIIIIIGLFLLMILIASLNGTPKNVKTNTSITLEDFKKSAINDLSYDELARNVETYVGAKVHYLGKVVQTVENPPVLRINVAQLKSDQIIPNNEIVWITRQDDAGRILENDTVEIWGIVKGPKTYKAALGQAITIPEINSYYLTVVKKAAEE